MIGAVSACSFHLVQSEEPFPIQEMSSENCRGIDMEPVRIEKNSSLTVEDFGHEVVAIDLNDGSYFSLKGLAAELWRLIDADLTLPQIIERISASYVIDAAALAKTSAFLMQCKQEGLISFDENALNGIDDFRIDSSGSKVLPEFELEKISDIQDILLLDPIHDVDDTGWPHSRSDGNG